MSYEVVENAASRNWDRAHQALADLAAATARAERAEAEHRMCPVTEAKLLARVERAEAAIQRVRELHQLGAFPDCRACGDPYPCLTIAAMDSADAPNPEREILGFRRVETPFGERFAYAYADEEPAALDPVQSDAQLPEERGDEIPAALPYLFRLSDEPPAADRPVGGEER